MDEHKFNLFIYGSLKEPGIFKSVSSLGFTLKNSKIDEETLLAEPAFLTKYKKVSPDNVHYYAVKAPSAKIEGYVIHDIPVAALVEIDRYEGKRYNRITVNVHTANGLVEAQAYLVSNESMRRHFGDRFHVNLTHELWLRKRIEKFIKKHTRPGDRTVDADIERRAFRELVATTERDLVMAHYGTDAVSDYYIEHELDRPYPSIKHLYEDPEALPFIDNYLELVIRQTLLNQLDEKIQTRYRFDLEHIRSSERYFSRSISLLVALRIINQNRESVELIVRQGLDSLNYREHDLIDYVKFAVRASKSIFDKRVAKSYLGAIRSNLQPGLVPLGAEIELSNLGPAAVEPQRSAQNKNDMIYAGFKYFYDFRLDVLSWKLGGYIDDHTGSTDLPGRSGFLELAPGRLNITSELSRPATNDPWLLNQLIGEIVAFYKVKPHSLHLSFQLRKKQIGKQKILPLDFVKCMLILGGGLRKKNSGRLWLSRMGYDEITQFRPVEELVFARTSKRNWYLGQDDIANKIPAQATTHIQQYKFIRLEKHANYEPLILCLKGLQLEYNPGDYLRADQLAESPKLREEYQQLKQWAHTPTKISHNTIKKFINTIRRGLLNEGHHRPVHKPHYIDWAVSTVKAQLRMLNEQLEQSQ
ncbi:MAG: gamma-glutamylcyclotransferase [Planctomycetota bacterium]|jgi:gamma-glutamylcyclotransferase (GGCT)/AIG2-like uncharacterized protein YtfP